MDPQNSPAACYVYFIQFLDAIKIGFAHWPEQRFNTLNISFPYEATMLGKLPFRNRGSAQRYEKNLHTRFASLRLKGEWFRAEQQLLDHIKLLCGKTP